MQRVGLRGMLDLSELSAWEIHFKSWIRVESCSNGSPKRLNAASLLLSSKKEVWYGFMH
jgi:hypothetical protein